MLRNCLAALLIVCWMAAIASAVDYQGKVTAFDAATRKVTIHVDDNDQTYELTKDCKVYKFKGNAKHGGYSEDPKGLKDVVPGAMVNISTDFVDGNEVVTMLKITKNK